MAKKVSVELVDDFDGESTAQETVGFGVDGCSYEIDLSSEHADQLRNDFQRWAGHARRINGRKASRTGRAPIPREQLVEIREWARRRGHKVADRGRISKKIVDAFNSDQFKSAEVAVG